MGKTGVADEQVGLESYAGPGGWNDPDMLQIGNGSTTLSEDQAHLSLWSILAAPLFAGNRIAQMPPSVRDVLANREVIAVDQDPRGIEGRRIYDRAGDEIWARPLADGSVAVVLLNSGADPVTMSVTIHDLGLRAAPRYSVRNLWTHTTSVSVGLIRVTVPAHGAVMLRVQGTGDKGTQP